VYRSAPEIFEIGKLVADGFRSKSENRNRSCAYVGSAKNTQPLVVSRLRSQSEEAQYIAHQFKRAHLIQGIAYADMAVILRSEGTQSAALRRAFSQVGIPVAGDLQTLANNPAIAPFLLLARVATGEQPLNLDTCERLLLAEFGGTDSISLRRIRTALLASRDDESDKRAGTQLIIDAIDKGDIPIEDGAALTRVHELLKAARIAARKKGARAEDVLGAVWDNAKTSENELLSTAWKKIALRGGSRGAAADRDLDAMIQLFDSAARFSERFPYSRPSAFFDEISGEAIAGDLITAKGVRSDVVEILTVHSAKGREWKIVAVAGLQEGVWPNLKTRSSLLGSERLVERERHGDLARKELDVIAASALAEDERRLLHVAVTRAKETLIVTAVQREEDEPSTYFDEIAAHVFGDLTDSPVITEVPRPLTTPALIATLRHELGHELDSARASDAAALLKTLITQEIPGATPETWLGSKPLSTNQPLVGPDGVVSVSPSGAETFTECGVKWFFERSGGTNGDSTAQILGSAIHEFARIKVEQPEISEELLTEKLISSWPLIDQSQGWISATALSRAIKMLERFARYHAQTARSVVGAELEFEFTIGQAKVRGSIDRVEVDSDGNFYVIDFKTGKNKISGEKAKTNLQLAAYQLAVALDGFKEKLNGTRTTGAELVYLAEDSKKVTTRTQPVINKDEVIAQLQEIAVGMGAESFIAKKNDMCKKCVVRSSCPIQNEGRTVIS
jgi:ATP-dependent exoDNAse (exonuclease V) beta subunit